jgi:hypothetical protein
LLSQFIQPTVVVICGVSHSLSQFRGNFLEGVALMEEEVKCLTVALGEFGKPTLRGNAPVENTARIAD